MNRRASLFNVVDFQRGCWPAQEDLHPPRCPYNVRMSGIFGSLAQKSNKCWFSSQLSLDLWKPYSAFYEILEIWFVYMHFVTTQTVLTDDNGFACICKLKLCAWKPKCYINTSATLHVNNKDPCKVQQQFAKLPDSVGIVCDRALQ